MLVESDLNKEFSRSSKFTRVIDSQVNSNANTNCPFLKTPNVNLAQLFISLFDVCGPHSADEEMEWRLAKAKCFVQSSEHMDIQKKMLA